jgi:predicted transcriptional regulator
MAKIPLKEEKQLLTTLQRMRELGLIHKTKGKTRKWTKEHGYH